MEESRLFDLNIEKILEAWDIAHAVRELIANAIDEQVLTGTSELEIRKELGGSWVIRDLGRGLKYEHFTQNENQEKLRNSGRVIGKFGVGLKDALATLDRNGIGVEIESAHNVIRLAQSAKHGFGDVITLHAAVYPPRNPKFVGTAVRMEGLGDEEVSRARSFFLRFSGESTIEDTRIGQILEKKGDKSRIYIAGLLVAEEENFAFSYNITSLTESMKKALNRERTNVGRTAYSDRVKAMLLQAQSQGVARALADQIIGIERGLGSDEVRWKDVAVHACRILNASGTCLFVTASQVILNAGAIDQARKDGLKIVTLPDNIHAELVGAADLSGGLMRDLSVYQSEWNNSFKFEWVTASRMNQAERAVYGMVDQITGLVGGMPPRVKGVRVSRTMRPDFLSGGSVLGLWDPESECIVIRYDQLQTVREFAGVLLHELAHARSSKVDVTREFEAELTDLLGVVAAAAIDEQSKGARKGWFWHR